jgi:hypothetical protein
MTIRGILLMSLFLSEMNLCMPLDTAVGNVKKVTTLCSMSAALSLSDKPK